MACKMKKFIFKEKQEDEDDEKRKIKKGLNRCLKRKIFDSG